MIYYKAVRPDGTDFYTGTVQWARPGEIVTHPTSTVPALGDLATFLSVSTDPTRLPGSTWPLRLFEVEAVGDVIEVDEHKRGGVAFRVVREVDAHLRFGPMGEHVAALVDRAGRMTPAEARDLDAAWAAARAAAWGAAQDAAWGAAGYAAWDAARAAAGYAAWDAAWDAARAAARDAAWDAARAAAGYAAWDAAWDAAGALVVRDLIGSHGFTQAHFDTLTGPWRKVIGPVHPDDAPLSPEGE